MTSFLPFFPHIRSLRGGVGTRQWLGIILLGHLLLALLYSLAVPPWEAHDEWAHYRYAAFVAQHHALPDPTQRLTTEFEFDEASQPPLYYLLAAAPMLAVEGLDDYEVQVNPYISGDSAQTGVNMAVHDAAQESFPWRGAILALHLGRFVSILISLLALVVTFAIIRYLSRGRPEIALAGTAIQAFAPQFVFISAVITNDVLSILLESLLLYFSLRLIVEGPRPRLTFYVALTAGLALLTKYLALAVLPLALLAFLWGAWRHRRNPRLGGRLGRSFVIFMGVLALTAGAWLWHNYQISGVWIPRDPVSQRSLLTGMQDGGLDIQWAYLPRALLEGFYTYWASFGWGNVSPDRWVYVVWLAMLLAGGVGVVLWLLRTEEGARARRLVLFLALFVIAVVGLPLLRELLHNSPHLRGRYMLATLPIAAWVLAQGWAYLGGQRRAWLSWGVALWAGGLSIYLLFFLLTPAYAAPRLLAQPPRLAIPIDARFDDAAQLLSAEIWPTDQVEVGQGVGVSLAWRVLARTPRPYALSIKLVGAGGQSYGGLLTYPGQGVAATNVWRPGIFSETYWLTVQQELPLPTSAQVLVSFYNPDADSSYLPVYDSQGAVVGQGVHFGSLRIGPGANKLVAPPEAPPVATFGNVLALEDMDFLPGPQQSGSVFPVWLRWRALAPGSDDLLLSLQLLDANKAWVAGADGAVSNILLPQHWRQGDILDTVRWFPLPDDIPPGDYTLVAVLYRAGDLSRLDVIDARGERSPDSVFPLGAIKVR